MRKHFSKHKCNLCERSISIAGFAQYNHALKHQREGLYNKTFGLTEAGKKVYDAEKSKQQKEKK